MEPTKQEIRSWIEKIGCTKHFNSRQDLEDEIHRVFNDYNIKVSNTQFATWGDSRAYLIHSRGEKDDYRRKAETAPAD